MRGICRCVAGWAGVFCLCLRIKQMTELRCWCHDGALGGDNFSGPVHPLTSTSHGFHFGALARGLHNNEEAGGLQSTGDGLRVRISSGYVERSAMGAALCCSCGGCQPGPGPAHARAIIPHLAGGWWGPAGGPGAGTSHQPPYVCVIRTQTSASSQHAAAGTGGSNWHREKFL